MTDGGLDAMRMHSWREFQTWLANDLEVRDELAGLMGTEPGIGVDSLDELEAFLLRRYDFPEAVLRHDQRGVLDAAARHVGLVMVLGIDDATWDIDLDDADDVFHGLPVVRIGDGPAECPLSLVTAALDRRTGDYVRGVVENLADTYNEPEQA